MRLKVIEPGHGVMTMKQANITVEAAFVMPIVIYMLFALIYLAFFLHDWCIIQGKVDHVMLKAAITAKYDADSVTGEQVYEDIPEQGILHFLDTSAGENEIKITDHLRQELESNLFLSKLSSVEITKNIFGITISSGFRTDVRLPLFGQLFRQYSYMEISEYSPRHDPAETIRAAEVILNTGSEIKGMDKLKETIEEFLKVNN